MYNVAIIAQFRCAPREVKKSPFRLLILILQWTYRDSVLSSDARLHVNPIHFRAFPGRCYLICFVLFCVFVLFRVFLYISLLLGFFCGFFVCFLLYFYCIFLLYNYDLE